MKSEGTTRKTSSRPKKIALGIGGGLSVLILGLAVAVLAREDRKFPSPRLRSTSVTTRRSSRAAAIWRSGRRTAWSATARPTAWPRSIRGRRSPSPVGASCVCPSAYSAPPTSHPIPETGIGGMSGEDIARLLRHGVRPDGRAVLPFMAFGDIAQDDLDAIVSFVLAQKPIRHEVKPTSERPRTDREGVSDRAEGTDGADSRDGAAGAHAGVRQLPGPHVANCVGCHTKIDMRTGAKIGQPFAAAPSSRASSPPTSRPTALGLDRQLARGGLRGPHPPRPTARGFADALGRLPQDERRRFPRHLPLPAHASPGAGRPRSVPA